MTIHIDSKAKQIIELNQVRRLRNADIARVLGCSEPNVTQTLQRYGLKAVTQAEALAASQAVWEAMQATMAAQIPSPPLLVDEPSATPDRMDLHNA